MTTRIQEQKEEGVVFKSRLVAMNPSFFMATSSSSVSSPIVCKSAETPIVSEKPDSRMKINPNSCPRSVDVSSTTKECISWRIDVKVAFESSYQEEESEDFDNPATETWYYKEESVAQISEAGRPHGVSSSVDQETTISKYRRTQPIIWNLSFPWSGIYGRKTWRPHGRFWMWIWLFEDCSWISLCKQQFISERTMTRIYITRRIISGTNMLWNKKKLICEQSEILVRKTQISLIWN